MRPRRGSGVGGHEDPRAHPPRPVTGRAASSSFLASARSYTCPYRWTLEDGASRPVRAPPGRACLERRRPSRCPRR